MNGFDVSLKNINKYISIIAAFTWNCFKNQM